MSAPEHERWYPEDTIDPGTLRVSISIWGFAAIPPILLLHFSRGTVMAIVVVVLEVIIAAYWWYRWGRHWHPLIAWRHWRATRDERRRG